MRRRPRALLYDEPVSNAESQAGPRLGHCPPTTGDLALNYAGVAKLVQVGQTPSVLARARPGTRPAGERSEALNQKFGRAGVTQAGLRA